MSEKYLRKLTKLVGELKLVEQFDSELEVRHFFSGAALYVDGQICASWSPVGLAFKLSEDKADKLIASGNAKPLKYFPNGHVKKGYALFERPTERQRSYWKKHFIAAANGL